MELEEGGGVVECWRGSWTRMVIGAMDNLGFDDPAVKLNWVVACLCTDVVDEAYDCCVCFCTLHLLMIILL